ncbi:MAG TPA: starch synthase [Chlorobaculum parvum]|uniref:Glycogen synthase n=1 Tax=Chlorobaculum parvum TaxID=274539 RepID=A0A7C5HJE1_9CHLB|nr:starch synthase [Chlorobaculum parvum]
MPRRNYKVLYVSGEVSPFVRVSSLADFMASFPQALEEEGFEARIMMPKYGIINDRKFRLHDVLRLSDIEVALKEKTEMLHVKVTALPSSKIQTYFLYNEKHFKRSGLFSDLQLGGDHKGSAEKLIFFSVGVMETLVRLGWQPDIIHCNDWHAGLVPLLARTRYAKHDFFKKVKIVQSVYNVYRRGVFQPKMFQKHLDPEVFDGLEREGDDINLLATGIKYADLVTTTSPSYAKQIAGDPESSFGMDKALSACKDRFYGILNGMDTRQWNPSSDKLIKKRYSAAQPELKLEDKKVLLEEAGLPFSEETPVVGVITNFDDVQGMELLKESLPKLLELDFQLIVFGSGNKDFEQQLRDLVEEYPEKLAVNTDFTDAFYHQMIAGLDMLIMPSRIESCGMKQMFAMNYGTVPVAYAGGGIVETIEEVSGDKGTGFVFTDYTAGALTAKLGEALSMFADKERWAELMREGMERDFSWSASAEQYAELYREILG